jgi:hypothetical protein
MDPRHYEKFGYGPAAAEKYKAVQDSIACHLTMHRV